MYAAEQTCVYINMYKVMMEPERKERWYDLISTDYKTMYGGCKSDDTIQKAIERTIVEFFNPHSYGKTKVIYSNHWITGEYLICHNEELSQRWSAE